MDMRNISYKDGRAYFCSRVVVGQETVPSGGGIGIMPVTGSDLIVYEREQAEAAAGKRL